MTGTTRSIQELPGPRGLPLIGSVHQVKPSRFHSIVEGWSRQYGPIYRFTVGPRSIVAVADPDVINTVLRDRPDGFSRPRETLRNSIDLTGTFGVFHAEGDDWRHMRRLAVTALNSNHLQRYFDVVRTCTERLYARLQRIAETGAAIDIGGQLTSFTVDVTSSLAFGHDLNTLQRGESELQQHIKQMFYIAARRLILPVPYWRYFKLPVDRAADRSWKAIESEVHKFIGQARERIKARPELREAPENFLEGMIAAQETDETYTDEEIVGNVFTLLFAGEDTTAHTMAWTTWFLAREPEIQRRWAAEADAVLRDQCSPRAYETIGELRYGEAVLRESMRLKPVAPILGVEPLADTTLMDTRIPRGTRIILLTRLASLSSISRANEFDPDRWLSETEDGNSEAPDQKSFLAFGAGPRFCPGRNLAFLESKSALAMIARNFELELDASAGPVTERFTFTVVPEGLRVRLRERTVDKPVGVGAAEKLMATGPAERANGSADP